MRLAEIGFRSNLPSAWRTDAVAAKTARPEHPAIAMLGDGTAGFYFIEFETALREEEPLEAFT